MCCLALVDEVGQPAEDFAEDHRPEARTHDPAQVVGLGAGQGGGDVDGVEGGRIDGHLAGAGHPEDPSDSECQHGVALDVELAGEVLEARVALTTDQADEPQDAGAQHDIGVLPHRDIGQELEGPVIEGQGVSLEQGAPAFEVEPDDAGQPLDTLLDGVFVQSRQDPLDRSGSDLVSSDERHEVIVGSLAHLRDKRLGGDLREESQCFLVAGGAELFESGSHDVSRPVTCCVWSQISRRCHLRVTLAGRCVRGAILAPCRGRCGPARATSAGTRPRCGRQGSRKASSSASSNGLPVNAQPTSLATW